MWLPFVWIRYIFWKHIPGNRQIKNPPPGGRYTAIIACGDFGCQYGGEGDAMSRIAEFAAAQYLMRVPLFSGGSRMISFLAVFVDFSCHKKPPCWAVLRQLGGYANWGGTAPFAMPFLATRYIFVWHFGQTWCSGVTRKPHFWQWEARPTTCISCFQSCVSSPRSMACPACWLTE